MWLLVRTLPSWPGGRGVKALNLVSSVSDEVGQVPPRTQVFDSNSQRAHLFVVQLVVEGHLKRTVNGSWGQDG